MNAPQALSSPAEIYLFDGASRWGRERWLALLKSRIETMQQIEMKEEEKLFVLNKSIMNGVDAMKEFQ